MNIHENSHTPLQNQSWAGFHRCPAVALTHTHLTHTPHKHKLTSHTHLTNTLHTHTSQTQTHLTNSPHKHKHTSHTHSKHLFIEDLKEYSENNVKGNMDGFRLYP